MVSDSVKVRVRARVRVRVRDRFDNNSLVYTSDLSLILIKCITDSMRTYV